MTTNDPTGAVAEHLRKLHAWAVALETSLYQGEWTHDDVREALSGIVDDAEALAALAAPATGGGDNEHLAAIRELLQAGNERGCLPFEDFERVEHNAMKLADDNAALRARLAEAEVRVGRWESYWLAEQHDDTPMTDWLARVKAVERKLRECGDLPDAKGGDAS